MARFNEHVDDEPNHSVEAPGRSDWFTPLALDPIRKVVNETGIDIDVDVDVDKNSGTVIGMQVIAQFGWMLEPQPLSEELLKTVRRVFQKPLFSVDSDAQRFDDLVDLFVEPGSIVVIGGKAGTGRTITAIALLETLQSRTGAEVSTIGYGAANKFQPGRLPQEHRHGFLLELPADDEEFAISSDFGLVLRDVREKLQRQASHLVIVTTDEQWSRIGLGAPAHLVAIRSVPNREIMESWLDLEAPEIATASWVHNSEIQKIVDSEKTPQGVMEVVRLIVKAGRAAPEKLPTLDEAASSGLSIGAGHGDSDSLRRIASVVAARKSWRRQLLSWHRDPARTGFQRDFLLAAAILPETPAGEIYAAARTLTRRFGGQVPGIGQKSPGVIHLADLVEAELTGDSDILEFPRPGWEDAVLQYFWVDRPESRQAFLKWIAHAPLEMPKEALAFTPGTSTANKVRRAQRMASFALRWASRQRRPEFLNEIVVAWHGNKDLWPAAIEALTKACFDISIGKDTHKLLLSWSQLQSTALRTAVADVCSSHFGRAYPGKALVRIAHVGESNNSKVIEAARKALGTLWKDHSLRGTILSDVLKWCSSDVDARSAAGRRAFLALAEIPYAEGPDWPDLLSSHEKISDAEVNVRSAQVSKGWHYVLESSALTSEVRVASALWFSSCISFPQSRRSLIGIFHEAVSDPARDGSFLHHRLLDLLYEWDPGVGMGHLRDQVRHDFADALLPRGSAIIRTTSSGSRNEDL